MNWCFYNIQSLQCSLVYFLNLLHDMTFDRVSSVSYKYELQSIGGKNSIHVVHMSSLFNSALQLFLPSFTVTLFITLSVCMLQCLKKHISWSVTHAFVSKDHRLYLFLGALGPNNPPPRPPPPLASMSPSISLNRRNFCVPQGNHSLIKPPHVRKLTYQAIWSW